MSERYEIGSSQWLAALHAFMVAARPALKLSADFTLCEVYRNVPPSISSDGTVAFTTRFRKDDQSVDFELREANDATFKLTIDYECVAPIARMVVNGDGEKQARLVRGLTDAVSAGRATIEGEMPGELMDFPVHDQIAGLTA